jgi:hypothetical protein
MMGLIVDLLEVSIRSAIAVSAKGERSSNMAVHYLERRATWTLATLRDRGTAKSTGQRCSMRDLMT